MSELLLRRRALLEATADAAEGGGINDGKNIMIFSKSGWNTNRWFSSTDFGATFTMASGPTVEYSQSGDLDSAGGAWQLNMTSTRLLRLNSPVSTTYNATLQFKTGSGTGTQNILGRAVQVSSDMSKVLIAHSSTLAGNILGIKLLNLQAEGDYRTGSVVQSSTNIPAGVHGSSGGPLLEANRDTLQHVIMGSTVQQRWGAVAGYGNISHDWGATWNNIAENIEGVSHSIAETGTNKLRSVAWSADGKYCGVIYNNTFYLSQDSGYHFTSMSCPETPIGIFASQKFKTLYFTAQSGSIYRSQDKGKTWIKVNNYTGAPAVTSLTVNDAGDKLWFFRYSSSGADSTYASYSHDYGNSWTGSMSGSKGFWMRDPVHSSWRYYGSRDHVNL